MLQAASAQESAAAKLQPAGGERFTDGLFIDASLQYAFPVADLGRLFTSMPSFQAALGWSYKNWSFYLQSGLHELRGKTMSIPFAEAELSAFVDYVRFVPLTVAASYSFPIYKAFRIEPRIGAGVLFTDSLHSETAIDLLTGNKSRTAGAGFVLQAGVDFSFKLLDGALFVYAGAGFDLLPERTLKAAGFPRLQAGLKVYPFRMAAYAARVKNEKKQRRIPAVPEIQSEAAAAIEQLPSPPPPPLAPLPAHPLVLPDAERQVWTVFFLPEQSSLDRTAMQTLDDFIAKIRGINYRRVYVRGYTAPFGSPESQLEVAGDRIAVCVHYLESAGVEAAPFIKESIGSQTIPEGLANRDLLHYYRSVQIIVE